jgi:hypothetical protein
MRIIYIPDDFHLIVNHITKTLLKQYESDEKIYLHLPSYFEVINIIIQFEKDEIQMSTLFNYDLSAMTIVETQEYYYISMGMYTACHIAYKHKTKSEFSEALQDTIKKVIPNIFDRDELEKDFIKKTKKSIHFLDYSHNYMNILDDIYTMNNSYMDILNKTDLDREELNKLFRISVRYLISLNEIVQLRWIRSIFVIQNNYNFYQDKFYDFSAVALDHGSSRVNIIRNLNGISKDDKYTNSGVQIEFKSSIAAINEFTQVTCHSYMDSNPEVLDILPAVTICDAVISVSLDDIVRYANGNQELGHLRDLLIFKNIYMSFALYGDEKGGNINDRV